MSDYPAGTVIDPDGDVIEVGVYGHLVSLRAIRRDGSTDVTVHLDADLRDEFIEAWAAAEIEAERNAS